MAELIAELEKMPDGESGKIMKDKRGMWYGVSPLGVYKYQSKQGQDFIKNFYEKSKATKTPKNVDPLPEETKPKKRKGIFEGWGGK